VLRVSLVFGCLLVCGLVLRVLRVLLDKCARFGVFSLVLERFRWVRVFSSASAAVVRARPAEFLSVALAVAVERPVPVFDALGYGCRRPPRRGVAER